MRYSLPWTSHSINKWKVAKDDPSSSMATICEGSHLWLPYTCCDLRVLLDSLCPRCPPSRLRRWELVVQQLSVALYHSYCSVKSVSVSTPKSVFFSFPPLLVKERQDRVAAYILACPWPIGNSMWPWCILCLQPWKPSDKVRYCTKYHNLFAILQFS